MDKKSQSEHCWRWFLRFIEPFLSNVMLDFRVSPHYKSHDIMPIFLCLPNKTPVKSKNRVVHFNVMRYAKKEEWFFIFQISIPSEFQKHNRENA